MALLLSDLLSGLLLTKRTAQEDQLRDLRADKAQLAVEVKVLVLHTGPITAAMVAMMDVLVASYLAVTGALPRLPSHMQPTEISTPSSPFQDLRLKLEEKNQLHRLAEESWANDKKHMEEINSLETSDLKATLQAVRSEAKVLEVLAASTPTAPATLGVQLSCP